MRLGITHGGRHCRWLCAWQKSTIRSNHLRRVAPVRGGGRGTRSAPARSGSRRSPERAGFEAGLAEHLEDLGRGDEALPWTSWVWAMPLGVLRRVVIVRVQDRPLGVLDRV